MIMEATKFHHLLSMNWIPRKAGGRIQPGAPPRGCLPRLSSPGRGQRCQPRAWTPPHDIHCLPGMLVSSPALPWRPLHLEVPALGAEEVLDVALGVSGEAQHEVPLDLELVDGLNRLVDLQVERHELSTGQAAVGEAGRGRGGGAAAVPWKGSPWEGGVGRATSPSPPTSNLPHHQGHVH